ncbi:hypothetical protein [Pseudomonas sp. RIT-PI-AD]|uniref:hypothetical protein n=1 Tax=Pseudomonas sp. RIT-PI-AD TaxID=3035294 RepID=UPI0021DAD1E1|nr:hypothetical protein [Pseudomonas sp. RIT-PI-AD]
MASLHTQHGELARVHCELTLPLQILYSRAGYYIGTVCEDGLPCSRESREYFDTQQAAEIALQNGTWTQYEL